MRGPLDAAGVQRIARQKLWSQVIECYRLGAHKDPSLRGKATLRLSASRAGKITGAKVTDATLPDREVVDCLAQRARSLPLPAARAGSTLVATVQVSPGDDPMEPPAAALTPGDGSLAPEVIAAAVAAAAPAWRACYEAALAGAPALWGRLAVRLHVTAGGAVDEAFQVESRFPDEPMVRCVLRQTRSLTFPPPTGGDLRFVVPLRFSLHR